MTVNEFLSRLDGVKGGHGQWTAKCPAHDDRRASLSVYFVRQLIQEKRIPFIRSGTKYYIDAERAFSVLRGGEAG